jgi:hypothetical protein
MACATALPLGAHAADNVAAAIDGREPARFRYAYVFRCISLGRAAGLIQFVRADDSPRERIVSGRLGAWIKEMICQYTSFSLDLERRWPGAYHWPQTAGSRPANGVSTDLPVVVGSR